MTLSKKKKHNMGTHPVTLKDANVNHLLCCEAQGGESSAEWTLLFLFWKVILDGSSNTAALASTDDIRCRLARWRTFVTSTVPFLPSVEDAPVDRPQRAPGEKLCTGCNDRLVGGRCKSQLSSKCVGAPTKTPAVRTAQQKSDEGACNEDKPSHLS